MVSAGKPGLVNTNVIRTVDLQGLPFVREQVGVVVQNEHDSKVYKTYTISVPMDKFPKLSQLSVHERKSGEELDVSKETVSGDTQLYRATLRRGLQPGEKLSLNIDYLFVSLVEPRPKAVGQSEDQSWLWEDQSLVASVYPTRKQKTVVKTRGDVLRFTPADAVKDGRHSVVFGPYTLDKSSRVEVGFKDNKEQMEALTHRREYFVSHWANDLNVLEHYALRNRGPELSGGFDKVDQMVSKYMKRRDNLVKTLLVKVPADAREMYFVDEIGNVSTSAVSGRRKGEEPFKVLQMRPRYPMPGGWNYTWWHGYSVPLDRYLKISSAAAQPRHLLRLPFIGTLAGCASQEGELTVAMANAQNTAVRAYELRVTLPEGARDIDVKLPFAGQALLQPTKYYFDSVGRTVVVITHENIAPEMSSRHILVSYSYAPLTLWMKPAVVAAALFMLFMLASAASRMQYGLTPSSVNKRAGAATKSKAAKKQAAAGKAE
ncbi:dolichyl-diphosphooligosaccharide--protein glycosyltransferase subunit 1 [Coemansia sp. S146]|nr:dolichyl-diphosphooligosaccharide--protein glycosyltransferase subunit 1 [Coemansia sp. S146]